MILNRNKKVGLWLVLLITLGAVVALLNHGPISQTLSYHGFADRRVIWGIPNFFNVFSNIAFVLVGLLGLYKTSGRDRIKIITENRVSYKVFFIGVALVGVGSGYYHLPVAVPPKNRLNQTAAFNLYSSCQLFQSRSPAIFCIN